LRDIKFRVWDKENELMVDIPIVDFGDGTCYPYLHATPLDFWNDVILMQSTELKDKNENVMYEGDVIKGKEWNRGKSHRHIGVITYIGSEFKSVGVKQYRGYHGSVNGSYEVIGNIYENPGLIE
jgi:uncharacterized phage protein (TIGR01671 family)